ncbi:precorrin-2 C(20)-methyltransferase [Anaerovibrio slackiae]|uniref:precorrin-2 C(20)-methyltransferase n=1 Tax=Anaerovibrio slackiae TaxID=2652309 RepID=UPI003F162A05
MAGKLFGIGVGPGDPELLTVKAINAIKQLDVIIAPKTEKKDGSVALNIASQYIKPETEIVYQVFPMTVGFAEDDTAWQSNKQEILELLQAGKNVGFLTLGDPMFYSTYIYVFRLLQHEAVEIETIPGIPAFCAIGSATNTPIVEGDSILSIIPANMPEDRVRPALKTCDNAVLMKVYKNSDAVIDMLAEEGLAKQAVLASRCGLDDEVIIRDISGEKGRKLNYLSTILTRR